MPLKGAIKEIEIERRIGSKYFQLLGRAEALVPGAGREAIELLLWDANAAIIRADVQADRVVLDGSLNCQAVYRQGEEKSLRAISAKSNINQVTELVGAQSGMLCQLRTVIENVDAHYENGHMVFLVSIGLHISVMQLENLRFVDMLEDGAGVEARYQELQLTKLAAEATETAVLTERVELPQTLDARATLMDWGSVTIESCQPDLGGVRVKGRVQAETLVASGIEGRPAVLVKYPIEFDKLLELPEWLSQSTVVTPSLRAIRTQIEPPEDGVDGALLIQADVHFSIAANVSESVLALEDAYSTTGMELALETAEVRPCTAVLCARSSETIRGTVLLEEGAPAVGSVIAARALANIAEISPANGGAQVNGLLDITVLYMPAGGERPTAAHTQLPFEISLPVAPSDSMLLRMETNTVEANALMGDRLEMKLGMNISCEDRVQGQYTIVTELQEGEQQARKSGYIICWPDRDESAWSIAKRYGIPSQSVESSMGEEGAAEGTPIVLRI